MKEVNVFAILQTLLETALQKLPKSSYELRHDELIKKLKGRREQLHRHGKHYRFIQK
jgi:hypothetical protein